MWKQFYRGEPFINDNGAIVDFPTDNNNTPSFKYNTKAVNRIENYG